MTPGRAARQLALTLSFLGLVLNPVYAQSVLGKAIMDGRTVLILSDGTWHYEDEPSTASGDCEIVALGLSFCGSSRIWMPIIPFGPDTAAAYQFDDLHYGQIIAEGIGSDHGIDMAFIRTAVLKNAAAASGRMASDIPVLYVRPAEIDGMEAETIVYSAEFNGVSVVSANTMLNLPQRTFQMTTSSVGSRFTDKHQKLHADFLEYIRIE